MTYAAFCKTHPILADPKTGRFGFKSTRVVHQQRRDAGAERKRAWMRRELDRLAPEPHRVGLQMGGASPTYGLQMGNE